MTKPAPALEVTADADDLGFAFRATKRGEVAISRHGRTVVILRGKAARAFLDDVADAGASARQQAMARVTGNYKRGNERSAAGHPRNRSGSGTP